MGTGIPLFLGGDGDFAESIVMGVFSLYPEESKGKERKERRKTNKTTQWGSEERKWKKEKKMEQRNWETGYPIGRKEANTSQ